MLFIYRLVRIAAIHDSSSLASLVFQSAICALNQVALRQSPCQSHTGGKALNPADAIQLADMMKTGKLIHMLAQMLLAGFFDWIKRQFYQNGNRK